MKSIVMLFCAVVAGCSRLPPGRLDQIAAPPVARVVLVRGFLDWYSSGVDRLANELRCSGIPCNVFRDNQWRLVSDAIMRQRTDAPLLLIGFSYGADDVILISRVLAVAGRPVALLITIDPVTPANVPSNVYRCKNFYESNGVWDLFPWLRGIPLMADLHGPSIDNINIRHRPDLFLPGTSHATIATNARVHAAIIAEVKRCLAKHQPVAGPPLPTNATSFAN